PAQVADTGLPDRPCRAADGLPGLAVQRLGAGTAGHRGPAASAAPEPRLRPPPPKSRSGCLDPHGRLTPERPTPMPTPQLGLSHATPCWPRSASITTQIVVFLLSTLYSRFFWG